MNKKTILLGLSYGLLWYAVVSFIYHFELTFPTSSWAASIIKNEELSDFLKILSIRALWATEFDLHILLAAAPAGFLIAKFYPDHSLKVIMRISLVAIALLSVILLAVLLRYVPLYFSIPYITISFVILLFISVKCAQYVYAKFSADNT